MMAQLKPDATATISEPAREAVTLPAGSTRRLLGGIMSTQSTAAHSDRQIIERFWAKVAKGGPEDCWLWTASVRNKGYGAFGYTINGETIQDRAHRFSWVLHNGPIPDGLKVLHNCPTGDNPACVNPAHLFLGTILDNNRDMIAKGRRVVGGTHCGDKGKYKRGTNHPLAVLNPEIIRQIRAESAAGVRQCDLRRKYGLNGGHLYRILKRKVWKHVD